MVCSGIKKPLKVLLLKSEVECTEGPQRIKSATLHLDIVVTCPQRYVPCKQAAKRYSEIATWEDVDTIHDNFIDAYESWLDEDSVFEDRGCSGWQ